MFQFGITEKFDVDKSPIPPTAGAHDGVQDDEDEDMHSDSNNQLDLIIQHLDAGMIEFYDLDPETQGRIKDRKKVLGAVPPPPTRLESIAQKGKCGVT